MIKIKDIVNYLELIAPTALQESYDNSGLLVGNTENEVNGILVSLDITEEVIHEAIATKCNLIVAHHPIIFKGIRKLTGGNYVERCIILAIQHNISLYAIHTNLDNISIGVNKKIGEKIGITNSKILVPKSDSLLKLTFFVPTESSQKVQNAIFEAGAGNIGEYKNCSFTLEGLGQFIPSAQANPAIGSANILEKVNEHRIEVIVPIYNKNKVLEALKNNHPYEEVAYYLSELINENQEIGAGMYGELENEIEAHDFLALLKKQMNLKVIRHTPLLNKKIKRVAWCGGSGSFLLKDALKLKADIFITGDFKYHEFFDANNQIVIADIGHYESEFFTKELIVEFLIKKFTTFAVLISKINTNPVNYY